MTLIVLFVQLLCKDNAIFPNNKIFLRKSVIFVTFCVFLGENTIFLTHFSLLELFEVAGAVVVADYAGFDEVLQLGVEVLGLGIEVVVG